MSIEKPRYQQIKDFIVDQIISGALQPSDRVPSENELVAMRSVSRMTANRALRELHDEGYVERVAGRGTFVADYRSRSDLLEVENIAVEISRRGHVHTSCVLLQSVQRAHGEIAKALHVVPGTDVFHLMLVHNENTIPIQLEDRYILADFAPDCLEQDFDLQTPSAYLTGVAPLQEAEQLVRACLPKAPIRQQLDMPQDEASLVITRRTWSQGRPVTFARLHHPGSRFELSGRYTPPGASRVVSADVVQLESLQQ